MLEGELEALMETYLVTDMEMEMTIVAEWETGVGVLCFQSKSSSCHVSVFVVRTENIGNRGE